MVPYPAVEWTKVRPSPRSLPQPEKFPIIGCPEDPEFYPAWDKRMNQLAATFSVLSTPPPSPFGSRDGFLTSQGVVAPPEEPVHGYIFSGDTWVIHAVTPSQRTPRRTWRGLGG